MSNAIRIGEIRRVTINGRAVKVFKAYRPQGDAYLFVGQFSAPARTADEALCLFVRKRSMCSFVSA